MRVLVLLGAALLSLAGCVSPAPDDAATASLPIPQDVGWALRALPSGSAHDHRDPAQHANLSTPNFQVIGWNPLEVDAKKGVSAGGWSCGETGLTAEGRRLAVVNSFTTDVMFVLVDVTDPANPVKVGEFLMPEGHAYDVAMTPDGTHVLIAQNNLRKGELGVPAVPTQGITFRNACTGQLVPTDPNGLLSTLPGVVLVSVKDPAKPVVVDGFFAGAMGPHSVATALVDNVTYAVVSALQASHQGSVFEFFTVEDGRLVFQSAFQAPPVPGQTPPLLNGHMDGSIAKHPVTKQVLAYLANWNAGMVVVDISNVKVPIMVSSYSETTDPTAFIDEGGAIHGTLAIEGLWDGKHYVLAGQELTDKPKGRPTGWVYVFDDTDPANLKVAGKWTIPVDVEWNGYLAFSLHYFALVERTLFVTAYHGGMWAVDLSTPEAIASPPTLGVFVPDRVPPNPPKITEDDTGTPDVEDVLPLPDGTLVTFDAYSGAYTLRFDKTMPVPTLPAWTATHPK